MQTRRGRGRPDDSVERGGTEPPAARLRRVPAPDSERRLVPGHDPREQRLAIRTGVLGRGEGGGNHRDSNVAGRVGVLLDPGVEQHRVREGGSARGRSHAVEHAVGRAVPTASLGSVEHPRYLPGKPGSRPRRTDRKSVEQARLCLRADLVGPVAETRPRHESGQAANRSCRFRPRTRCDGRCAVAQRTTPGAETLPIREARAQRWLHSQGECESGRAGRAGDRLSAGGTSSRRAGKPLTACPTCKRNTDCVAQQAFDSTSRTAQHLCRVQRSECRQIRLRSR